MNFKDILNTRNLLNNPISKQSWPNLQKIIIHLQGYLTQCSKNRQYIEAQRTKQKIQEYRKQMKNRSLDNVQDRLNEALKQIDCKQNEQLKNFSLEWQLRHNKVLEEFNELLKKKINKQNEQRQRYLHQLQTALPQQPSPDSELHKLRWQQDQYVKQGNFLQAQKMKDKIQSRETYLMQKHGRLRENNINQMMGQLQQRHNNEILLIEGRLRQKTQQVQSQQKKKRKQLQMKHAKQIKQLKWIFNQQIRKLIN